MMENQVGPPSNTVANAYYYRSLRATALLAGALKNTEKASSLNLRADKMAAVFQKKFFDRARKLYIDGEGSDHASLHANMFPLAFGLVPAEFQSYVADFVESRGMACSVYGAQFLLEALYESGRPEAALALMTAKTERSWSHMIDLGSTMTLEAWDEKVKPNLTWNHAWGTAPANIISRYLLGVRPLTPGYGKMIIEPQPAGLIWINGKVPTPHGPVEVSYRNRELEVTIPDGTVADIVLTRMSFPGDSVLINDQPASVVSEAKFRAIRDLASGYYRITFPAEKHR